MAVYKGIFLSFSSFHEHTLALILSHWTLNILCQMFRTSNFHVVLECPLLQENFFPGKKSQPASLRIMGKFDMLKVGIHFCSHYSRGRQVNWTSKSMCIHSFWWLKCELSTEWVPEPKALAYAGVEGGGSKGKAVWTWYHNVWACLVAQLVKNPPAMRVDLGSIPGLGRSPGEGKGYPLRYSGLVNSTDCIIHRVAKSQTRLSLSL